MCVRVCTHKNTPHANAHEKTRFCFPDTDSRSKIDGHTHAQTVRTHSRHTQTHRDTLGVSLHNPSNRAIMKISSLTEFSTRANKSSLKCVPPRALSLAHSLDLAPYLSLSRARSLSLFLFLSLSLSLSRSLSLSLLHRHAPSLFLVRICITSCAS